MLRCPRRWLRSQPGEHPVPKAAPALTFAPLPALLLPPQVQAIFKIASSQDLPAIPDALSPEASEFILLCLQRDPLARPSADDLLRHPFVANAGFMPAAGPGAVDGSGGGAAPGQPAVVPALMTDPAYLLEMGLLAPGVHGPLAPAAGGGWAWGPADVKVGGRMTGHGTVCNYLCVRAAPFVGLLVLVHRSVLSGGRGCTGNSSLLAFRDALMMPLLHRVWWW